MERTTSGSVLSARWLWPSLTPRSGTLYTAMGKWTSRMTSSVCHFSAVETLCHGWQVDSITFGPHHLRHLSAWHCCKWPNPKRCQRARTGDSPAKHVDPCGLWLFNLIQDPQIYAKSFCFRKINKGHLVLQLTLFLDFETSDFLKQIWVGNKDCPIDASGQTRLIQKLAFLQDFNKLVPSSDPVAGFQPSNSSYFIRFFRIQHLAGLSTRRFHRNLANPHLSSNKISPP